MTDITETGSDAVLTGLRRVISDAGQAQGISIKALGDRYLTVLQSKTPLGRGENPGALIGGYEEQSSVTPLGASYRITNTTPYLRYVLKGRGRVTAVNAKALRFVIDGVVFFRRSVGPAAPNNFPARAKADMQGAISAAPGEIAGRIVRLYRGGGEA